MQPFPSLPVRAAIGALALAFLAHAQPAEKQANHGISIANMDPSVKPGDNFYLYANGGWLNRTEIPPDRSRISVFTTLSDLSNQRTRTLVEEAAKGNAPAGSETRKVADLYHSYMDEAGIESHGLTPIEPSLAAVAAIADKTQLARALGETLRADVDALNNANFHTHNLFGLWVAPGFSDSAHYAPYLTQGGLQLPNRDYYLSDTQSMRKIRASYQAHIAAMLKLAGFTDLDARAARIFALEHAIAETHWSLTDNQEVAKANNPWKRSDFPVKAPGLDWDEYFRGADLSQQAAFRS